MKKETTTQQLQRIIGNALAEAGFDTALHIDKKTITAGKYDTKEVFTIEINNK